MLEFFLIVYDWLLSSQPHQPVKCRQLMNQKTNLYSDFCSNHGIKRSFEWYTHFWTRVFNSKWDRPKTLKNFKFLAAIFHFMQFYLPNAMKADVFFAEFYRLDDNEAKVTNQRLLRAWEVQLILAQSWAIEKTFISQNSISENRLKSTLQWL